jgi:hypothetical protein
MYWHFFALGVLALFILAGFLYRLSTVLFFLGFTYVFLLDQARYLNHFYLVCLISLLLVFVPAHRAMSFDARMRPGLRSATAPAWALWLLLAQIGIVYFYGGVAKLNGDWLRGEPVRAWLANSTDFPVIGPFFTEEPVVWLFVYGGLLLDLLAAPFLLWRRTRWYAFGLTVSFHLLNARLFSIGIFPWFMIAATVMFFSPSWPRTLLARLLGRRERQGRPEVRREAAGAAALTPMQKVTAGLLGAYLAVQLLLPLRHWLYPENVSWTEEGHQFSWHMKLRDKDALIRFVATDPVSGQSWQIDPRNYLTRLQFNAMVTRPDMILQFAHHVAEDLRGRGYPQVQVRAHVMASLNGREPQLLLDPQVDLASQPRTPLLPAFWILPLTEPLATSSGRRDGPTGEIEQ